MKPLRSTSSRTIQAYTTGAEVYLKEWHRRAYREPPHLQRWMTHLPTRSHVLDLGCGPGQDSRHLRRQGFRIVGLDLTYPFLQAARKRSPKLALVHADMTHPPFQPNAFNGIWAAAALIHLPKSKLKTVLGHIWTITCPGGVLGATLAHGNGSSFLSNLWIPGRFVSKWHKKELRKVMERAGWEVVSLETVCSRERKGRWLNVIAKREG